MAKRFSIRLTVFGLLAPLASACVPAEAQTHKSPPLAVSMPAAEQTQIDGILSSVVDDLWKQNDKYWHQGDYPRIVDLDRVIVKIDPGFQECYSTGAWLMDSMGRRSDAEAFYQLAVQNNSGFCGPYYDLGMFYFNTLKDYPTAAVVFQRGAATKASGAGEDKNKMLTSKMLAHAYERSGDFAAALKTWQTVKKRWPNAPAVDSNLRRVQAKVDAMSAG